MKLKDYRTNTLSHVESHLIFNIPSWEGGSLVPGRDTNLYTCSSSSNREGPGVNSTTLFRQGISPQNSPLTLTCFYIAEFSFRREISRYLQQFKQLKRIRSPETFFAAQRL